MKQPLIPSEARRYIDDLVSNLDLDHLKGWEIQIVIDACFSELQRRKHTRIVNRRGKMKRADRSPRQPG